MNRILKINLHDILRSRLGGWKRILIPGFAISLLERIIHQDELNEILEVTYPAVGKEFSRRVYNHLNLKLEAGGLDKLAGDSRYIFASNHPLGGLDGIGLIKLLGGKYGDEGIRFIVNDMLMNVEPLRNVFLPVNKYGSQRHEAAALINEAYESDRHIIIFPAGLVSRLKDNGEISDLEWQKSFILKAIAYKRDIVPVTFHGLNRRRFYKIARLRKKLGIKFNIEQILLPSEVCASRGNHYRVEFGSPISWQTLQQWRQAGESPQQIAESLRLLCIPSDSHSPECRK
ncbi:MAG: 1-acyl-sn-glycerol-3-phosphate acyltransferase [Candidatus Amulumruptor caecigallinarius]|nr:1-acyl-sn-glycerol-3-phosphate acyltransferase [Candidatus Amulumruptor caecigallinarius]